MSTLHKFMLRTLAASRRYVIEAFLAMILMVCIEVFVTAFEHPLWPTGRLIDASWIRRACIGALMGGVIAIICVSPWGKRSGAHMNPAVTLTFWTLDRMRGVDAVFYIVVQLLGATLGVKLAAMLTLGAVAHPMVDYAVTSVGPFGATWAFVAEGAMAFLLMTTVLWTSERPGLARFTPGLAGAMVALFITVEAPVSGMSINPARSFSAGVVAGHLEHLWHYAVAPTAGMMAAAALFRWRRRGLQAA